MNSKTTANTMQQIHLQLDSPQDVLMETDALIQGQAALASAILQQTCPDSQRVARAISDYKLVRSRRRTLGITVHRAVVEVRAPLRMPKYWINEFIAEKQQWIEAQLAQQQAQLKNIYRIIDGNEIPILGKPTTIRLLVNNDENGSAIKRQRTVYNDSILSLYFSQDINSDTTQSAHERERIATQLFLRWIKKQAADYMSLATRKLADTMGLSDRLSEVKYRRTSSKWGHCTSEGVIQYNPLIAAAPLYVVDYIIAHEVCHLRHANHSRRYWNLVDQVCKQREQAENWLSTQGYKLAIEAS